MLSIEESIPVPAKKPVKKTAPVGDATSTARAGAYLERLTEAKGKRLVVDLDEPALNALEVLIDAGYAKTQKSVVIKALIAAQETYKKKP